MKRIILLALSIALAGTFAIAQAHDDTHVPHCDHCETVDGVCCCGGTVDGCTEDCNSCDECDCSCEGEGCTDCEENCTCDTDDCSCIDCSSEEDDDDEEEQETHHCGGCH